MTTAGGDQPWRAALKRVASILKEAGIPFALGGSYASWARGGPESEHDVDFLVTPEDVERAVELCAAAGLRTERPPEDWLAKVWDDSAAEPVLIDLIHAPGDRPVTRAQLEAMEEIQVDALRMPVLSATDYIAMRLRSFSEHTCDFATLLPHVRALREQLDWPTLQTEAHDSPFAAAFLLACERLGLTAAADLAPEYHEANLHRQLTTDPRVAELGLEVQVVGDRVHVRGRLGGADCREQVTEVLNEIAPHLRIVNEVECVDLIEPAADEAEILS